MSTQQDTPSTTWKPQPGDTVTGVIEDISEHDAGYGRYPILELATENGTVTAHCFHEVLQRELARRAPKIGDSLTITYGGKHAEKGYHTYKVQGGNGAGIDWSRYGAETPAAPQSDVPSEFPDDGPPPAATNAESKGNSDVSDIPF